MNLKITIHNSNRSNFYSKVNLKTYIVTCEDQELAVNSACKVDKYVQVALTLHSSHFSWLSENIKVGSGLLQIDPAHRWNFSQTFFEKNQNKKVNNFQKSNTHLTDFLYFCNMLLSIIKYLVIKLCNMCVWGGGGKCLWESWWWMGYFWASTNQFPQITTQILSKLNLFGIHGGKHQYKCNLTKTWHDP